MRIVIADYSGHPFQVQLSRELAKRGHAVLHLYFAEFQTPKGRLTTGRDDPETLGIEPISLGQPFAKHRFVKRRFQEVAIGKLFATRIAEFGPDVVVASNMPLDSLRIVATRSRVAKYAFIFWQQDIYSIAIERILTGRLGALGKLIGKYYRVIERTILRESQAVVTISDDFPPYLNKEFGISSEHIYVVENWAPLDEITPRPKSNPWARANDLAEKDVVLYTGTLGMKHDPRQILGIAERLRGRPNTEIVVVSEGPAVDWLVRKARELKLPSLRVLGFQPFNVYSDVLASASVLICILESDSGIFSVPSKVLSYLCAGRPIVIAAPPENLASRTVEKAKAGLVALSGDFNSFIDGVCTFLTDRQRSVAAGTAGRNYAEKAFNIWSIGNRFEEILLSACERNRMYYAVTRLAGA